MAHRITAIQTKLGSTSKNVNIFLYPRHKLRFPWIVQDRSIVSRWHILSKIMMFACVCPEIPLDALDDRLVLHTFGKVYTLDQFLLSQHSFVDHHRQEYVIFFTAGRIFSNRQIMYFQTVPSDRMIAAFNLNGAKPFLPARDSIAVFGPTS